MKDSLRLIYMAGGADYTITPLIKILKSNHKIVHAYTKHPKPAGRGKKLYPSALQMFLDEKNIALQKYYMTLTEACGINIECINITEPYEAPHLSYAFQWLFFAICLSIVILRKNKLI